MLESAYFVVIVVQWRHMATQISVNIDSGNGLLPDGANPLPDTILKSQVLCGIQLWAIFTCAYERIP